MNIEDFRKMKELKEQGLSQFKAADVLGTSKYMMRKCWHLTEEEFIDSLNGSPEELSRYDDFILDILKVTPTIPDSNIYYKIREAFIDFNVSEGSFRKYIKKLRIKTGYDRFRKISTTVRDDPKPGEEAQVDFGQYKITDIYGKRRLLYFIVIVLRYSQLKYVFFLTEDFNAKKAIEAHLNAFRFFGGVPEILMYDQDKVFAVSENYGNLILVREFEEFLRQYELSIVMCSGYHPQGKGTVENYVKIVKDNFLLGRLYSGIDSLNSACLEWLDNTENNHVLTDIGKTPHQLFQEEYKHLKPLKLTPISSEKIEHLKVYNNTVKYKYAKYEVPVGYEGMYVKVETDGYVLILKDKDNGKILCSHKLASRKGERVVLTSRDEVDGNAEFIIKNYFNDEEALTKFLDIIKTKHRRYYHKICIRIRSLTKYYSKEEIISCMNEAMKIENMIFADFIVKIFLNYGFDRAKKAFPTNYYHYKKKAMEERIKCQSIEKS